MERRGAWAQALGDRGSGIPGDPAWSPDGKWIAIESDWGSPALEGIWIIPSHDNDGITQAEARRLTTVPGDGFGDGEPQFSPDGRWVVAHGSTSVPGYCRRSSKGPRGRIAPHAPDKLDLRELGAGLVARWQADRLRLRRQRRDQDQWRHLGHGCRRQRQDRLTHNPKVTATRFQYANNPSWSPDGKRIAFTQWKGDGSLTSDRDRSGRMSSDVKIMVKADGFQNKGRLGPP